MGKQRTKRRAETRKHDPHAKRIMVTPAMAAEWLGKQFENRPLRKFHIQGLAHDMTVGHWVYDASPIKFNVDGKLTDGQHRLQAVILSEKTIEFLVVGQLPRGAARYHDGGVKRTVGDRLGIKGEKDAHLLGSAVRLLRTYRMSDGKNLHKGGSIIITDSDIEDQLAEEPGIRKSTPHRRVASKVGGGASIWVFLHYLLSQRERGLADVFMDALTNGQNISAGEPVHSFREQLVRALMLRTPMDRHQIALRCIKAWNYTRQGIRVSKIQISHDETELPEVA